MEKFGLSKEVVNNKPNVNAIERNNLAEAGHSAVGLAIDIRGKVEGGLLSPKAGDVYFLLLAAFSSERFHGPVFR